MATPPNSLLRSNFDPWNINYMPMVKFITRLDLWINVSLMDRHWLTDFTYPAYFISLPNGFFQKMCWRKNRKLEIRTNYLTIRIMTMFWTNVFYPLLMQLVQNYRRFSRIPEPVKKIVPLAPLFNRIEKLIMPRLENGAIHFSRSIDPNPVRRENKTG